MSVFDKTKNQISLPSRPKPESNSQVVDQIQEGFFFNLKRQAEEQPLYPDHESVEKIKSVVKVHKYRVRTCPQVQVTGQGYVDTDSWDRVLAFYDNKMDLYLQMDPPPYDKIVRLERWIFELISPPPTLSYSQLETWRIRELAKLENFYSPYCPSTFRQEVAKILEGSIEPSILDSLATTIRKIEVDILHIIPPISSDPEENKNRGIVQLR